MQSLGGGNYNSLRAFGRDRLSDTSTGANQAQTNRDFWYWFYVDYFYELVTGLFKYENLPDSIPEFYIEKHLSTDGYLGFLYDDNYGLVCQEGTLSNRLDIYDLPLVFTPTNNFVARLFKKRQILWYGDELDADGPDIWNRRKAVIVGNNSRFTGSNQWIHGFATKLADIEQAIQINRNSLLTPYMITASDDSVFSYKKIMAKVLSMEPFVYVKPKKSSSGVDIGKAKDDINILNIETKSYLAELTDDRNQVFFQALTRIGINNSPIQKTERVNTHETDSNNVLINQNLNVRLRAREQGLANVNSYFGENIKVQYSSDLLYKTREEFIEDLDQRTTNAAFGSNNEIPASYSEDGNGVNK